MTAGRHSGPLTRRAVLEGAALVTGASLLAPAVDLARALDPAHSTYSRWVGSLGPRVLTILEPNGFSLVGVQWSGPRDAAIELRVPSPNGSWGHWVSASVLGHGPDVATPRGPLFGEPIWTGRCDRLQLRSAVAIGDVRLHFVRARASRPASAASLPLAQPVLDAGGGQPPIIARSAWAHGQAHPAVPPSYGRIRLAFVHHTENPNGYSASDVPAMLLAIFDFHRFVRGWNDIGYNFVIDLFGRIWEARQGGIDEAVIGAQAGGYNAVSTGVAVLGSFMSVAPSRQAFAALERLLAWKLSLHGVPSQGRVTVRVSPADAFFTPFAPGQRVSLPRIAGHRDGDSTNCPGDAFYARLPAVRRQVLVLAGAPAKLGLSAPTRLLAAGTPLTLSGRLRLPSGLPGASPIEIQALRHAPAVTIATATTAADGTWSAAVTLESNVLLRALHRPAPATASDLIAIGVAPVITVALVSSSPLRIAGTISPPKRHAIVELYALRAGHRVRVARKRITVRKGQFAATLASPRPGSYELLVRTVADARNVAAVSSPLELTL